MYPNCTLIRRIYSNVRRSKAFIQLLVFSCSLLIFFSFRANSQCVYPNLVFANPKLIAGTDGQIGAVYLFSDVGPGIDAHVEIIDLYGGAELGEIDNTAQGYYDAFQPYVTAGALDTSYLEWEIHFKVAGTYTDTILPCLAVTGVDVDGDNAYLKEFIEAATPGAFAVDPFTTLTVSFDGVRTKAVGQITTVPTIDTSQRQAMFQMNFTNVSSLRYRNGSISTKESKDIRHTCIYFRPFFYDLIFLPVKLLSFKAYVNSQSVLLNWVVTAETSIRYYTIQKSDDGRTWRDHTIIEATAATGGTKKYSTRDYEVIKATQYYRLKQTDWSGKISYSKIEIVNKADGLKTVVTHSTIIDQSLKLQIDSENNGQFSVEIYSMQGQRLKMEKVSVSNGSTSMNITMPVGMPAGAYLLNISDQQGNSAYRSKLIKN